MELYYFMLFQYSKSITVNILCQGGMRYLKMHFSGNTMV
jgi:hypothetical protein